MKTASNSSPSIPDLADMFIQGIVAGENQFYSYGTTMVEPISCRHQFGKFCNFKAPKMLISTEYGNCVEHHPDTRLSRPDNLSAKCQSSSALA